MARLNTVKGFTTLYSSSDEPEYMFSTMIFQQASAPTGWVRETNASLDNCGLTITNKMSGLLKPRSSGSPFSTIFSPVASAPFTFSVAASAGATTISSAQLPYHTHNMGGSDSPPGAATQFANFVQPNSPSTASVFAPGQTGASASPGTSSPTGTGIGLPGHTHAIGNADVSTTIPEIKFDLKYVDAIMATRY